MACQRQYHESLSDPEEGSNAPKVMFTDHSVTGTTTTDMEKKYCHEEQCGQEVD